MIQYPNSYESPKLTKPSEEAAKEAAKGINSPLTNGQGRRLFVPLGKERA